MQKIIPAERNRFMVPMPIQVCMRHLASQENCDGEEWDLLQEASFYIDELEARVAELETGLEYCAENLELALSRLGCPTHANDGGACGHDADSMGGISALEDARDLLDRKWCDEATTTRLSREDQARFVELLLNPPAPNAALIKARLGIK